MQRTDVQRLLRPAGLGVATGSGVAVTPLAELEREEDAVISLSGVVKIYHAPGGDIVALKGVDLSLGRGEFLGVIGKSGAGKTTLVNMITGIDHLTEGTVVVDGVAIHELTESELALWRGRNIGVIHQSFELLPQLSLLDNVMLPMDLCGSYSPRESPERAMDLLRQVGLAEHARKPPTAISGGQQQRVAIARALANDPSVIVADEPTGNLDSVTAEVIHSIFRDLVRQGKSVIVVTHDASLMDHFDHIVRIADGQVVDETWITTT